MQDASAAFATAVSRGAVELARPKLLADWLSDGYTELSGTAPVRYVVDGFDNRTPDAGWGRPDTALPEYIQVNGTDADYLLNGGDGYARTRYASAGLSRSALIQVGTSDMVSRAVWSVDVLFTGTGTSLADAIARDDGTGQNHYAARLVVDTAAAITVQLLRRNSGSVTVIENYATTIPHVAGHKYEIVIQVDGSAVRVMAWDQDTKIEPAAWQIDVVNTSIATGTYGGIRGQLASGSTNTLPFYFKWHDLRILDGSIDDLSGIHGQITVTQTMDDGLPSEVSFVRDLGTSFMNVQLVGGRRRVRASQYFSPFNTRSPLYGLARDTAPMTFEHGLVTDDGPELLRLFTGQMLDAPVKGGVARVQAISRTRMLLSKLVLIPPFNRAGDLSASWAISWALYQCGVYASPSPRDQCKFWAPMHGSLQPFISWTLPTIAAYNGTFTSSEAAYYLDDGTLTSEAFTTPLDGQPETIPRYVDGPYVAAPDLEFSATKALGAFYHQLLFSTSVTTDMLSQAGPRGRIEFAVRADDFETTAPSGTDYTPQHVIIGFYLQSTGTRMVRCGVNMSRQPTITISDGTVTLTNTWAAEALPVDGGWYKLGFAYDFVAEKVWLYKQDPDGTEQETSSTGATLDVTRLTATDSVFGAIQPFGVALLEQANFSPYFHSFLPFAELHVTAGLEANADNFPWIWEADYGWEASAIVGRSSNRLLAVAEAGEREAWELIGMYAQAELAAVRIDEHDRLLYMTPENWILQAQQTSTQTLSTQTNVGDLEPLSDPSKLRNQVRVSYGEGRLDRVYQPMAQSNEAIPLSPGVTLIRVPLDVLATELNSGAILVPSEAQVNAGIANFGGGSWPSYVTVNDSPDGAGTYYFSLQDFENDLIYIEVDSEFTANEAFLFVDNRTGLTLWTANDNPELPPINIGGIGLHQVDTNIVVSRADSISRRGQRGLSVSVPALQRREDAQRLAQRLLNELAEPIYTLEGVRVFGDQRRQPGDLVTFDDAKDTGASGLWRVLRVNHVIDNATYYQDLRLRQAKTVGIWGTGRWGQCLYGREGL